MSVLKWRKVQCNKQNFHHSRLTSIYLPLATEGHVVRQVAAPYSVWQRFPLYPIESNGNENFKVIQNPGFLLDHPQNWITGSFCYSRHTVKISERSINNFLSYLANTQTNRQTNKVWQKHYLLGEGNYDNNNYKLVFQCKSFNISHILSHHNITTSVTNRKPLPDTAS